MLGRKSCGVRFYQRVPCCHQHLRPKVVGFRSPWCKSAGKHRRIQRSMAGIELSWHGSAQLTQTKPTFGKSDTWKSQHSKLWHPWISVIVSGLFHTNGCKMWVKQTVHLSHLALGSVAFIKVCSKMDTTYPMINENHGESSGFHGFQGQMW